MARIRVRCESETVWSSAGSISQSLGSGTDCSISDVAMPKSTGCPSCCAASVHRLSISRLRWVRVSLIAGDTGPVITVGAELAIHGDERSSGLMVRADATPGVWGRVQPDGSSSNTPGGGVGNMSFMTPP
ncbi:hypothetical protein BREU_2274 [Bifidobacterium reuteri DSM 23975]|uniref:Uncharacterized protein n=1 Tax=Bifidobacterium reuteri DSM 23975 TaxID=1437610 RepID=A0A087CNP2_9BIFI|nr:hypothetical protein BREU_2274 [Bifidobacterium reuteri DSM 23975]